MPTIDSVLVTRSGGASMRITLPKPWCKLNKIEHHSSLQIMVHGVVIIFPPVIDKTLDVDKLMADVKSTLSFLKPNKKDD
jgi:hypothetical protein